MKIIICLPGESFRCEFLGSFFKLCDHLKANGHEVILLQGWGANLNHVRQGIVSGDFMNPAPMFQGLDYDYILWIDSDQVFKPAHVEMLIEANKDIVGAAIKALPAMSFACGHTNGNNINRIDKFKPEDEVVEVDFIGFGMILIKKGVFEKIPFPHFSAEKLGTNVNDMGEDFSFCIKAKRAGYKLYVHSKCRVGHIKEVMI